MKLNPKSSSNVCTWNYTLYKQMNRVFMMIYTKPLPSCCELFTQLRTTCDEISQLGLYSIEHINRVCILMYSVRLSSISVNLSHSSRNGPFLLIKSCNEMYTVSLLLIFVNSSHSSKNYMLWNWTPSIQIYILWITFYINTSKGFVTWCISSLPFISLYSSHSSKTYM